MLWFKKHIRTLLQAGDCSGIWATLGCYLLHAGIDHFCVVLSQACPWWPIFALWSCRLCRVCLILLLFIAAHQHNLLSFLFLSLWFRGNKETRMLCIGNFCRVVEKWDRIFSLTSLWAKAHGHYTISFFLKIIPYLFNYFAKRCIPVFY